MLNYTWSKDYSVENTVLDDHHKNLMTLFNDASKLLLDTGHSEATIKLISELKVYSIFHFREEEKLMKAAGYPDFEQHIVEHQKFIDEVEKFKSSMHSNSKELNEEIFLFLNQWLINHIQKTDKKYVGLL